MAIVFPASPSLNDTFTVGSITYTYDGSKWIGLGVSPTDRLIEGNNNLQINASNELVWTGGTAKFGGSLEVAANIDLTDSTVDLYSQTTNSASKTFQLFSDIGGAKTEKVSITANGSSSFSGQVTAGTTFNIANVSGSIAGSGGGQDYIGLRHGTTFGLMLKTAGTNVGNVGIGEDSPANRLVVQKTNASGDVGVRIKNDTLTDGDATNPTTASLYLNTSTGDFNTFYIQARRNDGATHFGYSNPRDANHNPNLVITSDGIVTKPRQPSFQCIKNGNFTFTSNTVTIIAPWTEKHDVGNDFNATTGVFTAPVTGKYFLYLSTMNQRDGNGDFQIRIYKNGNMYVNSNDMCDPSTTNFQQTTISAIVDLAANDNATFTTRNSNDTASFIYNGAYTHCGGYLIG